MSVVEQRAGASAGPYLADHLRPRMKAPALTLLFMPSISNVMGRLSTPANSDTSGPNTARGPRRCPRRYRRSPFPSEVTESWQLVKLAAGSDHQMFRATLPDGSEKHVTFSSALAKLKAGLVKAGLDPRFFAWRPEGEPDRPPYRGLRPLEADDAGIFFGREAPTIEALDRLRGLAEAAPPRFLVILGASGAGKSSFLRAGLIPRLRRDDRKFLVLPIVHEANIAPPVGSSRPSEVRRMR